MDSLFGAEGSLIVRFVVAFVIVLALIGLTFWLIRRFGTARVGTAAQRGRQPRLAVIDAAPIDGRRRLVLVRRDNVEHLLMIGGPTDVVVETNIVRAGPLSARDAAPVRNGATAPEPASWQTEPASAPAIAMRAERSGPRAVDDTWHPTDEPIASPAIQAPPVHAPPVRAMRPAETLASLAQELSRPAADQPPGSRGGQPESGPVDTAAQAGAAPDQSLAEMAQRLEAALRRPAAQKVVAEAAASRVAAAPEAKASVRQPRVVVAAQPKGSAQPAAQPNNLEQEMAGLLNKPGKT
jgi:flagellar protein FliO/FliZ